MFLTKKILLRVDCKSSKEILQKDVQNLVFKQIFARWQAILYAFYFEIEFIKGSLNVLPDFVTPQIPRCLIDHRQPTKNLCLM